MSKTPQFLSKDFFLLWESFDETDYKSQLTLALKASRAPQELTGLIEETRNILSFWTDLSPADPFWTRLAQAVRMAWPQNASSQAQLHQFRYLISAYQAQWVRDHYRSPGMTDGQALAAYINSLKNVKVNCRESARLHNKAYATKDFLTYPSALPHQANIKILLDFHTEFILDSEGHFLNIVDVERMTLNGVVNGASFNYGLDEKDSHGTYDVEPARYGDPAFRDILTKNFGQLFKSPIYDRSERGYLSKDGAYARAGHSAKWHVDQAVWQFEGQLKRGRILHFLRSLIRPLVGLFY